MPTYSHNKYKKIIERKQKEYEVLNRMLDNDYPGCFYRLYDPNQFVKVYMKGGGKCLTQNVLAYHKVLHNPTCSMVRYQYVLTNRNKNHYFVIFLQNGNFYVASKSNGVQYKLPLQLWTMVNKPIIKEKVPIDLTIDGDDYVYTIHNKRSPTKNKSFTVKICTSTSGYEVIHAVFSKSTAR